jgi:hypothetical protein
MATHNQRMTSAAEGEVVVFLIGMRVNRWWKPWQWLRTALAMPRMLRELAQHPELGMLGGEAYFGRTTLMVSYWKSTELLLAYSKLRTAQPCPHGARSIDTWAPTATWASGTRRTASRRATTRRCT